MQVTNHSTTSFHFSLQFNLYFSPHPPSVIQTHYTHIHTHTLPGSEVDNPKHIKRQLPFSRAHLQVIAQLDLPKYNTREAEVKIQAYKGHIQQSEGLGLV